MRFYLGSYDAAYLELAMRNGLPLATQNEQLKLAAIAAGVYVLWALVGGFAGQFFYLRTKASAVLPPNACHQDLNVAARFRLVYDLGNLINGSLDAGPAGCKQNHNRKAAVGQILLVLQISVSGDEYLKACGLRRCDERTVLQA
jgi:hypothetical protein